jgi:lipopolysaccharide export system permease protein
VESFNVDDNRGNRFTMEKYNNGILYYKMAASNIVWDSIKNMWTINNFTVHLINGMEEKLYAGAKIDTSINLKPDDFYRKSDNLDLMNFSQLRKFIKDERLKGSDNIKYYEVEKHKRIASPFSTFILTIIGVSVSSRKLRGGIGVHIAYGLALTFIYILFSRITETFATFGNLTPFVAVWIPNVLFLGIALYLLRIAPK